MSQINASEDDPFTPRTLAAMRGHARISQADLVKRLKQLYNYWCTQTEISRLENGRDDWFLRIAVSRYFRGLGYDAQKDGGMIYLPKS
jgi:hypothetical protein